MLVLDANVALIACSGPGGFDPYSDEELVAPPLMWSELRSGLHEAVWRRETSQEQARLTLAELGVGRIEKRQHPRLGEESWRIADELGLAKTYDAEYLALASLLECRLVTLDRRLRRGADRLGFVVGPVEL